MPATIVAIGAGPKGISLAAKARAPALRRGGRRRPATNSKGRIGIDLSVAGMRPRLHLPMLAGLAQGPGFPNLSSLGLLSDRILHPYAPDPETKRAAGFRGEVRQLV